MVVGQVTVFPEVLAGVKGVVFTWKTFGADTRQARAEERVAPNIPAVIRGANPDTKLMVYRVDKREKRL